MLKKYSSPQSQHLGTHMTTHINSQGQIYWSQRRYDIPTAKEKKPLWITKMFVRLLCHMNSMMKQSIKPWITTRYKIVIQIPKRVIPTSTVMMTLSIDPSPIWLGTSVKISSREQWINKLQGPKSPRLQDVWSCKGAKTKINMAYSYLQSMLKVRKVYQRKL